MSIRRNQLGSVALLLVFAAPACFGQFVIAQDGEADEPSWHAQKTTAVQDAESLWVRGDSDGALEQVKNLLVKATSRFGTDGFETLEVLEELAGVHELRWELDEALRIRERIQRTLSALAEHLDVPAWRRISSGVALVRTRGLQQLKTAEVVQLKKLCELERRSGLELDTGRLGESLQSAKAALEICLELFGPRHLRTAECLQRTSNLHRVLDQRAVARKRLEEALTVVRALYGDAHPETARLLNRIGFLTYEMGSYSEADRLLKQAKDVFVDTVGESHNLTADALNNLCLLAIATGDYGTARDYCESAIAIRIRLNGQENPATAQSLNNLAGVYYSLGDYVESRACLEKALELRTKLLGRSHVDTISTLKNLGFILQHLRDYEAAKTCYLEVLDARLATFGPTHSHTANAHQQLGATSNALGDYEDAKLHFEKALEINQAVFGESHVTTSNNHHMLGVVAERLGDRKNAREHFGKALKIRQAKLGVDHPATAISFSRLASVFVNQRDFHTAEEHCRKALDIQSRVLGDKHPQTSVTKTKLGIILLAKGDEENARTQLRSAVNHQLTVASSVLRGLSEAEAMNYVGQAISARDPLLAVFGKEPQQFGAVYEIVWQTRALASRVMEARRTLVTKVPEAQQTWNELRKARRRLAQLSLATVPPDRTRERDEALRRATRLKEQLERDLAAKSERFRNQNETESLRSSALFDLLPAGTALVDIVRVQCYSPKQDGLSEILDGRSHYEAFVISRSNEDNRASGTRIDLGRSDEIDKMVRDWRQQLTLQSDTPDKESKNPAQCLRQRMWLRLEPLLTGINTVVIIPEGALTGLPWSALPGRKTGSFLLEDYAICCVSQGQQLCAILRRQSKADSAGRAILVGGVTYDRRSPVRQESSPSSRRAATMKQGRALWKPLPNTLSEVGTITTLLKDSGIEGKIIRGEAATEEAIRSEMENSDYIHLATHGFFASPRFRSSLSGAVPFSHLVDSKVWNRNPLLLSGIVLAGANLLSPKSPWGTSAGADGILTAEEVVDLDLEDARLVVLSACETGLGRVAADEGVFGLQRAFGLAGARTVVASLWKVDDRATRVLMTEFYKNVMVKKLGSLKALRQAQLRMVREYEPGSGKLRGFAGVRSASPKDSRLPPVYWAGWLLHGEWR